MTRRVAILGLGTRGASWAQTCLDAGWTVCAFDPETAAPMITGKLPGMRRETTISAAVENADWILCCLPERLDLVQMVMKRALAEAPEGAVLAVASRDHEVDVLQNCTIRPGQIFRLAETEDGGVTLDVTDRNGSETRHAAEQAFAELVAVRSLMSQVAQTESAEDAKSA